MGRHFSPLHFHRGGPQSPKSVAHPSLCRSRCRVRSRKSRCFPSAWNSAEPPGPNLLCPPVRRLGGTGSFSVARPRQCAAARCVGRWGHARTRTRTRRRLHRRCSTRRLRSAHARLRRRRQRRSRCGQPSKQHPNTHTRNHQRQPSSSHPHPASRPPWPRCQVATTYCRVTAAARADGNPTPASARR